MHYLVGPVYRMSIIHHDINISDNTEESQYKPKYFDLEKEPTYNASISNNPRDNLRPTEWKPHLFVLNVVYNRRLALK